MAKRKKKDELPPCIHCGKVFVVEVRWCMKCEDHLGSMSWAMKESTCDRCHTGANDAYLKRKATAQERLEKALLAQKDPKTWGPSKLVEAYAEWIASKEYVARFMK